ncbi:hypothetical protein OTU49_000320, partial [Cherax quadricarinatus]
VCSKVTMRRSAAPSQLHKRAAFSPPFTGPQVKRQCINTQTGESSVPFLKTKEGPLRSPSDILSLIKNPDATLGTASSSSASHCTKSSDHGTSLPEPDNKQDRLHNAPGQDTLLSPLQETGSNVLNISCSHNNKLPGRHFHVPSTKLTGYGRPWQKPEMNQGHCLYSASAEENQEPQKIKYYSVVWCKLSRKKHKNWEGDAVLIVKNRSVILKDIEGKEIGRGSGYMLKDLSSLENGSTLPVGSKEVEWTYNSSGAKVVDVVIDPYISGQLRPHQHEGVIFLYECVMGYRLPGSFGAILADEMGLGKTLQCITLVWTLLKQGPYGGLPVVKNSLIVTPSSLTSSWEKEFTKWLGRERIKVYVVNQANKVEDFGKVQHSGIMIISYEMFVRGVDLIKTLKFDLLLCDEGHRLKNANIKTTSLLASINCRRKVIITGTPVQNDLQELFALIEYVNPGILTSSSFRHVYEDPIIASQQPNASQTEKELG